MSFAKIEINDTGYGKGFSFTVDGVPVKHLRGYTITRSIDGAPTVLLEIYCSEIRAMIEGQTATLEVDPR